MRDRPLLFFALVHVVLFLVVFVILSRLFYPGPGELERDVGLRILSGHLPYRDFTSEYLPLALLSFVIPAVFFKTSLPYLVAFAGEMLVLDLVALVLMKSLANRLGLGIRETLGAYTIFIVVVGALVVVRHDMLPAVLVLAAIWAFVNRRQKIAWAVVGLGFIAKIYPIVIAPLFAIYQLSQKQYRQLFLGGAVCVGVILVFSLPWIIIDRNGFLEILRYHADRGLQWESSYASLLLMGQLLHLTRVYGEFSFGSWNISNSSPLADSLSAVSPYITVGLLLVVYILYARAIWERRGIGSDNEQVVHLLNFSTLAVLMFLLANKVFSAQYLIWLCPLLPLLVVPWRSMIWAIFIIAAGMTQYLFPYGYLDLEMAKPISVALMVIRNALLGFMAILFVLPERPRQAVPVEGPNRPIS